MESSTTQVTREQSTTIQRERAGGGGGERTTTLPWASAFPPPTNRVVVICPSLLSVVLLPLLLLCRGAIRDSCWRSERTTPRDGEGKTTPPKKRQGKYCLSKEGRKAPPPKGEGEVPTKRKGQKAPPHKRKDEGGKSTTPKEVGGESSTTQKEKGAPPLFLSFFFSVDNVTLNWPFFSPELFHSVLRFMCVLPVVMCSRMLGSLQFFFFSANCRHILQLKTFGGLAGVLSSGGFTNIF